MTVRASVLTAAISLLLPGAPVYAQRLTGTVVPKHYDLSFTLDLEHTRFEATTGIDIIVKQPTREIRLNAVDLRFGSVSVAAANRTQNASVTVNASDETVTFTVPTAVPAGAARLQIAYEAPLNDNLRGLYVSRTARRSYAVTQFESTDARRAFPCFDEPAFKATFSVTVTADRGDTVISNGRMTADRPGPSPAQHTMTFSRTPKMSSYLVAIAAGDFECLEGSGDGIPIRICATPDKKNLGRIALSAAERILHYLNSYNAIQYQFEKLDIVAVPDFAAGAMENTAAIFYREADLLADNETASLGVRKRIYSILAHEMAHQWFGDLVTMAWWDDLWLNESFATWMAPHAVAALEPSWHMDIDAAEEGQTALTLDALNATHPIHVNVNTPAEIESVFDSISYDKGASVLRMLEAYVGADDFQKGVNSYLEKHKYGNATSEDFLGAISAASGKPVDRVIGTFVLQPGVPQVDVSISCVRGMTHVTIAQEPFTVDPAPPHGARQRWQIPMCLKATDMAQPTCFVFSENRQEVELAPSCAPWVFANAGGKGYYRTSYSAETIGRLARDAQTALTGPERLSLVSDEWALVRAGRHSVANYLDLVSMFGGEPVPGVLGAIGDRLDFIASYLVRDATRPAFAGFVRRLLEPAYASLGFDRSASDTEDDRSRRNVLLNVLGLLASEPEIASRARAAVSAALAGSAPLDPMVAGTLVSIAASHGDAAMFDAFRAAAARATSPQDHERFLFALTTFHNPALVERALEESLSPELRSQDTALYLASLFTNDLARDRAWAFVKEHWRALQPKIAVSGGDTTFVSSLSAFCSAASRDDIRAFVTAHPLPSAERALSQTVERINNCLAFRERQQPTFNTWISAQ
jgi:aminopeptidase N